MKKTPVLSLFLAVMLSSTVAQARICFLADLDCQQGLFEEIKRENHNCKAKYPSSFHNSELCFAKTYQSVCNDNYGNYYNETGCQPGYTDMDDPANDEIYYCEDGALACGRCCPNEKTFCKPRFELCRDRPPTINDLSSPSCLEPNGDEADRKYEDCICETQKGKYPFNYENCGEEGLVTGGKECHGDNGSWYEKCVCNASEGYSKVGREDVGCTEEDCNPNGCYSDGNAVDLPESQDVCWNGFVCNRPKQPIPQPKCSPSYKSDFDTFWCGYDARGDKRNITYDCATLGYDTGYAETGIKCKNGSEPYRCMFDHTKVFCESGLCKYSTEAVCKSLNPNSNCNTNSVDICYNPTSCKSGYYKSCQHLDNYAAYYIVGSDEFGCGTCKTDCEHVSQASCETANANFECSKNADHCYVPTGCKVGFKESNGNCVGCECTKPNKDDFYYVSYEGMSDCEMYGWYDGCHDDNAVILYDFDEAKYNTAVEEYQACLAECRLSDVGGFDCEFFSQSTCEAVNNRSTCVKSGECWVPSTCKEDYKKSCTDPYELKSTDPFGCGVCIMGCEFADKTTCESARANVECEADEKGCYVAMRCKTGFAPKKR